MSDVKIDKSDVRPILQTHHGNKILAMAIEQWSGKDLLCGLAQYIHFNSVFGGGVANLAGEIARRQDLFRDTGEPIEMLADQSVEVAAKIFFAAVDEFGRRKTHRAMAKETLRALAQYYGYAAKNIHVAKATNTAIKSVSRGYCLNQSATDRDILRSIGFHMGSELLADGEFNIIDRFLQSKHSNLSECLKRQGAYAWISVHTTVEADHFDAAVEGANCALQHYVGSSLKAKTWILEGFGSFARVQTEFMRSMKDMASVNKLESLSQQPASLIHPTFCGCTYTGWSLLTSFATEYEQGALEI